MACSIGLPLLDLARIAVDPDLPGPAHAAHAAVATACYLPLHVRHVRHAARGMRPGGAGWTLAAMAVVIVGALPVVGTPWLIALPVLAVSVLIVLRPPWSFLAAAGLVVAPTPVTITTGDVDWAPFYTAAVIWQGASLFVLVWLVGANRQLEAARLVLAEEVVARERVRIDRELRRTLGAALEAIVARGRRADELAGRDPVAAGEALRALVEDTRTTLAETRRMVRRYQDVSLRAELDSAAALLRAGGIRTCVVLPPGDLPETVDAASRATLHAEVTRLLRDGAARRCSIVVTDPDGRVRLELRPDATGQETTEVATT